MNAAANLNLVVPHPRARTHNNITSINSTSTVAPSTTTTSSSAANNTTTTTNGSLSDSLASTDGQRTPNAEHLSKTNLYIRGLQASTSDQDLYNMCSHYGPISSTKAILDKATGCCRGYGFVEFTSPQSAELAVKELTKSGIQAQMAKISPLYSSHQQHHHHHNHNHHHHQNNNSSSSNNNQQHNQNSSNNNNADPTNLYIANLPPNMSEQELENLLSTYGPVVSTRILRDQSNIPRGVGFARMESRDKCEQIIEQLNGRPCKGWKEPLLVKFADGGNKKRHHHNNQHQHHSTNHHQHHHEVHQDDSRWRDSSNTSDLSSVSNYDHQGNISHSNHLSDLAMMSTMSYPRMQPSFPPTVAAGAPYPTSLGPPTSAPQWMQPYVIPQQMIQAGGLGPSNQAALHYGHIPQLTSQMQGLQIAHPGAPVGGYLPPQHHQWSALWTHTIPQQPQPSMRLPAPIQPPPPPPPSQQYPPSNPAQLQPSTPQQSAATDNKLQVSMPL